MPISNFPNGFAAGVTIRGIPITQLHPGKVYFVNSSSVLAPGGIAGADLGNGTYTQPFATIDYAIGRCQASAGDIIMVMPGHTETISAASGIDQDVAGVAVIGLGSGSLRPTINYTDTASTWTMAAANCSMMNILHTGGIDAVVSPIVVSAADCSIVQCELRDVTGQMVDGILTTADADRIYIGDHFHNGAAAAGGAAAIALIGMDNPVIENFKIIGNFSVGGIDMRTTAVVDHDIHDGYIWTKNATDVCIVDTITASTGKVGPNISMMLTDNAANITTAITAATAQFFGGGQTAGLNGASLLVCNLAGESAMTLNVTQSTDA
jgi:hypothetical protein